MALYLGENQVAVNKIYNTGITVVPLNVTEEKTYTAPTGLAYSPVNVSISLTSQLLSSVIRPDATKIQTYSEDYLLVLDLLKTITQPYDTTSRTPAAAGARLTTDANNSVTVDFDNYYYYILMRCLTIPIYNIDTVGKGRIEYQIMSGIYQMYNMPSNFFHAKINNTSYADASLTFPGLYSTRMVVWSSASALTLYTGTSYGVNLSLAAPTMSNNKLIIKSPSIIIRGNSSYFTSTYYNALTDVRAQFVIDIYRAPKNHLNIDGWGLNHEIDKIMNSINSNNWTLV